MEVRSDALHGGGNQIHREAYCGIEFRFGAWEKTFYSIMSYPLETHFIKEPKAKQKCRC
jgi:hypothetical protein